MTTQFTQGTITQNGGVTRYAAGQDSAPVINPLTEPHHMAGRANGGTVAVNMRTGETELKGRTTYNAYEDQASRPGVMASFQPHNGGSVMVDGMRTSVAVALRLGAVQADGQGGYKDVAGKPEAAAEAAITPQDSLTPPEAGPTPAEDFDAAEWSAFEKQIAPIPQVAYDSTVALATVACLDGGDLEGAITRLARDGQMEPEVARAQVESVFGMYRDTVARSVVSAGVGPEATEGFFQWCRNQRGLQSAISSLTVQRDTKPFQALAREYSAYQARHAGANS
jgi:hypothetical protein